MLKYNLRFFLFCVSILLAQNALAEGIKIEIIDYGIYKLNKEFITIPDDKSVTGKRAESDNINNVTLLRKTTNIPLVKGTIFGFRSNNVFLSDTPETITISQQIPIMDSPNGAPSYYEYDVTLQKGKSLPNGGLMYILDEDYEMVSGKWIFKIAQGKKVLAIKEFTTGELYKAQ